LQKIVFSGNAWKCWDSELGHRVYCSWISTYTLLLHLYWL